MHLHKDILYQNHAYSFGTVPPRRLHCTMTSQCRYRYYLELLYVDLFGSTSTRTLHTHDTLTTT